ncbi:MAG TPA: cytochrome P450 [Trebonia sp.]|nr:cytochrome P450 [Trebonia sp.]
MSGTGHLDSALCYGRAPGSWPGLGHIPALMHHPLRLFESLPDHGDLVEVRLGRQPALVLCHPHLAREVLTDFRGFDRIGPHYDRLRRSMGNGLATASREDHRRQRLIMQPAFRREYMHGYASVMHQEIEMAIGQWREGQLVDMVKEMFRLTSGIALRALFSSALNSGEAEGLRTALDVFLKGTYARVVFPPAARLPTPGNLRYTRALAYWGAQVRRLVDESRRQGAEGDDLMSRLVRACDDEGKGMSDRELSDQVAVLLLAGGETTSAAVVWSMHLLNNHPAVLAALRDEADAILDGGVATWESLPRLELTARVVQEALRLYPPAWVLLRVATRDTSLAGQRVPAGSMVVFSPYVLHRRADIFPQPHRFDPDRWLAPDAHRGAFLPFGTGAAKCIGEEFGLVEATLILASIAGRWNFGLKPGVTVPARARAVLAPKRFPVYLSAR